MACWKKLVHWAVSLNLIDIVACFTYNDRTPVYHLYHTIDIPVRRPVAGVQCLNQRKLTILLRNPKECEFLIHLALITPPNIIPLYAKCTGAEGQVLVEQGRYFTIFAPRQAGKTHLLSATFYTVGSGWVYAGLDQF